MQTTIRRRFLIIIVFVLLTIIVLNFLVPKIIFYQLETQRVNEDESDIIVPTAFRNLEQGKWRGLDTKQKENLSTLARIMYLDEEPPKLSQPLKMYTILIWKYGSELELRHIKRYTNRRYDPFGNCQVRNCRLEYSNKALSHADIIVFDLNQTKSVKELPLSGTRRSDQIWAFLTEQSPFYTFQHQPRLNLSQFDGLFNWSMTYSMSSDIPIPYGRTLALQPGEKCLGQSYHEWNRNKKQDVLLAIVISTCQTQNRRWDYIKKLQQYLKVDIYGECGTHKCHFDVANSSQYLANYCEEVSKYKFYLAFENSNCNEYVTEKVWWYGYKMDSIPIVMGGSQDSYDQILPPYSYIHVEGFAKPRDLVNYIMYLNQTPSDIQQYFTWKRYFKVVNEHGFFHTKSQHYCRICEALNFNSRISKIYDNLKAFWNVAQCHPNWHYSS